MATHSSTLAWIIPWREDPGRLQSMGLQKELDMTERLHFHFSLCIIGSSFIHLIRTDSNVFSLMVE